MRSEDLVDYIQTNLLRDIRDCHRSDGGQLRAWIG
jgi:hypothetical protein